jgi:hypothetical protein
VASTLRWLALEVVVVVRWSMDLDIIYIRVFVLVFLVR